MRWALNDAPIWPDCGTLLARLLPIWGAAIMAQQAPGSQSGSTITVHPHGELTTYFGRTYGGVPVTIEPGITIVDLLERLGVPAGEVWLVAKNGETVRRETTLQPGDSVELFAPVAGG
jgi:sulfur carrier protein ThiS